MTEEATMRKIKIGEREFVVPENMAEAIEAQQAATSQQIESLQSQYAQNTQSLRDQVNNLQIQREKPEEIEEDDFDWADPKAAIDKAVKEAEQRVLKNVEEKQKAEKQQISAKEAEKQFWKEFYEENEDLKEYEMLVIAVGNKNHSKLLNMDTEKMKKELAELTRKELLKFSKGSSINEEIVVEPGVDSVNFDHKEKKSEDSSSLGSLIRKRNQARRQAKG